MPKRPYSHRLESESRQAFERFLGDRYVFRPDSPDYGIDGDVEEFDAEDRATGLRYYVQLKATAQEDPSGALGVRIPVETASLYGSLALPILMVGYIEETESLYGRWWHAPLPLRGKRDPGAASILFRWAPEDRLSDEAAIRIAQEAKHFLELRSAALPLPVPVSVDIQAAPGNLTKADLALAIARQVAQRSDVLEIESSNSQVVIRVQEDLLSVDMFGATAVSADPPLDAENPGEQIAVDVIALVGLAFARWQQADLAARIASTFFSRSTLHSNVEAAMAFASAMVVARRLRECLQISEEIDLAYPPEDASNTSIIFTLGPRRHGGSLTPLDISEYQQVLLRRIGRREESGDLVQASRELVSLANLFRTQGNPGNAVELFERAAKYDPGYLEREHYWRELGGTLFFADRFKESADAYGRAVRLGADSFTELLRADALMFAGRFDEARQIFCQAEKLGRSFESSSEYLLKDAFLKWIAEHLGITVQERDPAAATALVGQLIGDENPDLDPVALSSKLKAALNLDALNHDAWWNFGAALDELLVEEMAGFSFLFTSLCGPWDVEAWALAFIKLWRAGHDGLVPMILLTGERMTGNQLLPMISSKLAGHMDQEARENFMAALATLRAQLADPREDGFELRFISPDGAVESMRVPGAATRERGS